MSSRAPIGYLAIAEIPVAINQGFIALICNLGLPNHYVIHWLRENMETIESRANGTTFLEISKANFRPIPALVPPEPIQRRFTEIVGKLHGMIVANARESRTLAAIRDALLPKLMAGEIRVG
jgi:type I restriction enzyme S subunit